MQHAASALGVIALVLAVGAACLELAPGRAPRRLAGAGFVLAFACLAGAAGLALSLRHVARAGEELEEIRPWFLGLGVPLGVAQAYLALRCARET